MGDDKKNQVTTEQGEDKEIKFATSEKGKLETEAHDKEYLELTLHAGDHGEIAKRIMRQRIEQRALDFPRWPASDSAGTRALWIESRFWYDRERLGPDFDNDWREYRAKYLHSLNLDHREPVRVPEYEMEMLNPIRRFYMKPGDWIENKILKRFISDRYYSTVARTNISRFFMIYLAAIGTYYLFRYNDRKWFKFGGPLLFRSRPKVYPDHPNFPYNEYHTEPGHWSDIGFTRRTIYKDLRDYQDQSVIL